MVVTKRVVDLMVGVPLLILFAPLIAVLALMVWLVSGGPVFFKQERIGYGGRSLFMWKLRTMCLDADQKLAELLAKSPEAKAEWKAHCKLRHDPRVLPFLGNFLRRTRLDELPQLWNVVKGDMSLVGPRPLPTYHLKEFSTSFCVLRHSVMPGLTGLWQVRIRVCDGNFHDMEEMDTLYIQKWTLWMDFCLLVQTIPAVIFKGKGN